ncbi:MAG: ABC-type transport auxiliary lipoprotein family protein [Rhodanobacter sp.]|nr:ABC-type transport auxiliary lipoprotein family protein [Rhodanobacter sp.]
MSLRPRFTPIVLVVLLGGCSVLPKVESPDIYLLPGPATASASTRGTVLPQTESLRVDTPQASRALDSTHIAVVPEGNLIAVYQGARWSERAPLLWRDRLIDAFRASGRFTAVSSDDANLPADLELAGDLRAFQTEYLAGKPVVVIRYDAQLVRLHSQKILATRQFEIQQTVPDKEVPQVVVAFGQAADALATQVVDWLSAARSGER